ncbi:MAG: hypothetical protein K8R21_07025 [Leptospira sp.]|nr:hypothetical protein [Leptospira sp.]
MKKLFVTVLLLPFSIVFAQNITTGSEPQRVLLEGLGESQWGVSYDNLREKFISMATNPDSKEKIEVVNEVKNESLLIRRNGINYLYRFYKTPDILTDAREKKAGATEPERDPKTGEEKHKGTGSLFSVGITFNYVEADLLKAKVEAKYGKPKKETLDDNKISGALFWDLSKNADAGSQPKGGYIVQWKDSYKKKPYSRRMDYYSIALMELINKEYKEYFSVPEMKTLRELLFESVFVEKAENSGQRN